MSGLLQRRSFLLGVGAIMAAPAIVRVESLMKLPRPLRSGIIKLGDTVWHKGAPIGIVTALVSGDRVSPGVLVDMPFPMPQIVGIRQDELEYFKFGGAWPEEWGRG